MLKKSLLILFIALCLCLCGCGDDKSDSDKSIFVFGEKTNSQAEVQKEIIEELHICDISYDKTTDEHAIFFTLRTDDYNKTSASYNKTSASGTAQITILDYIGNTVYDQSIAFTKDDFKVTTAGYCSNELMCCLRIKTSDITDCTDSHGDLSITITLEDGTTFTINDQSIYNLPTIEANIKLPSLPFKADYNHYNYTSKIEVNQIDYTTKVQNAKATVTFNTMAKVTSKTDKKDTSETFGVLYKLYDSNNVVIKSGTIYYNACAVGESTKKSFTVYELDPFEEYTLKLEADS